MKKIFFIFLILIVIITGCNCKNYKDIMKEYDYVIIDVRTKEEYEEVHIKDAINVPYDEIDSTLNISKEKYIFVYCASGIRSKQAYNTLLSLGYNVYDLGSISGIDLELE